MAVIIGITINIWIHWMLPVCQSLSAFFHVKSFNSHLRNVCDHIMIAPILQMGKLKRLREVKSLAQSHIVRKKPSGIWTQVSGAKIQYYNRTINGNEVFSKGEIPWPILQKENWGLKKIEALLPLPGHLLPIYIYIHIYVCVYIYIFLEKQNFSQAPVCFSLVHYGAQPQISPCLWTPA